MKTHDCNLTLLALHDDVRKAKTLKFVHPKDKGKEYIRHYYSKPVNGHTLMGLGQYTNEMDFGDSGTCPYDSNKFNKVGITFSAFFLYI